MRIKCCKWRPWSEGHLKQYIMQENKKNHLNGNGEKEIVGTSIQTDI